MAVFLLLSTRSRTRRATPCQPWRPAAARRGGVGRSRGTRRRGGSPSLRRRGVTVKRAAQRRRAALKPSKRGGPSHHRAGAPWFPTTRAGAAVAARWATHPPTAVQGHTRVHTLPRLERGGGTHELRLSPPPPLHVARSPSGPCRGSPCCLSPGNGRVEVGASAAGTRQPVEAPEPSGLGRYGPPPRARLPLTAYTSRAANGCRPGGRREGGSAGAVTSVQFLGLGC